MTAETTQELGERAAKSLGWKGVYDPDSNTFVGLYDTEQAYRGRPDEPGECFKLCAEFNVWPVCDYTGSTYVFNALGAYMTGDFPTHDNTPTGRLNAAIEAVLLAVLAIKEQS